MYTYVDGPGSSVLHGTQSEMEMNYDENLENELDTKIYPGTEIMRDVGTHHFVKSGSGSDRVLVPQPSDDANDPLNWTPFWKATTITLTTSMSFMQGFGPLALAPMFPALIQSFDSTLEDVIQFTGVFILVLGFCNFIWVPIQTAFGRRPVIILSTAICVGSNIWRATAKSYGSFMGACILNGIGAGPSETFQPQVIADIFFLHERGRWMTLYFTFYFGSLMLGPVVAGPMTDHAGWRSFFWLNAGALGLLLILYIVLFPETKWHRIHPTEVLRRTSVSQSAEKNTVAEDELKTTSTNIAPVVTADRDPHLHRGHPSKWQFKPFQPNAHPFKAIVTDVWTPIKLFAFPIVEFASFVVSWSASSFLTINLTQSQAFAAPPYNFNAETIGLFNLAIFVGAMIGLFTNGWLSDWFAARLTRRNRGVREPEMRLPTLIPYVLLMLLGNFVVAFGYRNGWPWQAIVIIGYSCAGIQVAAIPAIVTTYAVDSYKPVAGSIMVAITVNKNLWGYGFSRFITEWAAETRFVPPIMLNMCLIFLWCSFGIVFYIWGKKMRGWSKNSSVHNM